MWGVCVCPALLQLFHNADSSHIKSCGEREGKRQAALKEDLPCFNKERREVCHYLFIILTSCLRKGYFAT